MKKYIDISTWNRREHFQHFRKFDDPYFGITVSANITNLYNRAKQKEESVFIHYFYQIMAAVNEIDEFRYRIEDDAVVCYETIQASSTIGRPDGTFAFCSFDYIKEFEAFKIQCEAEIVAILNSNGLFVNADNDRLDIIHFSPVPWLQFTEMKHPLYLTKDASIPKISTGKFFEENGKIMMPISISANHALMDGYHVAKFIKVLEDNISGIQ